MIEFIQCINDDTGFVWSRQCASSAQRMVWIGGLVASVGTAALIFVAWLLCANRRLKLQNVVVGNHNAQLLALQQSQQTQINSLSTYSNHLKQLNELSDTLQVCESRKELLSVATGFAKRFFGVNAGAVYLHAKDGELVAEADGWGELAVTPAAFHCDDCWALRHGKVHPQCIGQHAMPCKHLHVGDSASCSMCIPLIARGKSLGVITLLHDKPLADCESIGASAYWALAECFAEHLALALYNLDTREQLLNQSVKDPLTGLYNRRFLQSQLELEMARSTRSGKPFSVLTMDIDLFKRINDQYGHDAGDHVLQKISEVLGQCVRKSDVACRYGGEEFMLFLPGIDLCQARYRGEQLRLAIENTPLEFRGLDIGVVTVSIGLASFPQHGTDAKAILQQADMALYRSKHNGRNRLSLPLMGQEEVN